MDARITPFSPPNDAPRAGDSVAHDLSPLTHGDLTASPCADADAIEFSADDGVAPTMPGSIPREPGLSAGRGVHEAEVVKRVSSSDGGWIELLHDRDPHLIQQNFHKRGLHRDKEIVDAFGANAPASSNVLLHYAGDPPAGVEKKPVPVLLVHGANYHGKSWWDPKMDGTPGLAQYLRGKGYQVYAVTFAHSQDDNFFWEQQIANAINRIKTLDHVPQVDLIAHSKGGIAARAYCSDFREKWMTPYQGDVRRLCLVATPNGGLDLCFRHPASNYPLYLGGDNPLFNAPMTWDRINVSGVWCDSHELGMSKEGPDYWPGQRQLLAHWDKKYGLPPPVQEPDPYITYHGGIGTLGTSRGIDHFIKEGGNFMERLNKTSINPQIEVAVLAGNKPNIPNMVNEYTGPSDGILFIESALAVPKDTNVIAEEILPLNHLAFTSEDRSFRWLENVLSSEKPAVVTPAERAVILEAATRPDTLPEVPATGSFLAGGIPGTIGESFIPEDLVPGSSLRAGNGLAKNRGLAGPGGSFSGIEKLPASETYIALA